MSRKHRDKVRDANEDLIVRSLRAAGASVSIADAVDGAPDLLVGFAGRTELVEVKRPVSRSGRTTGGASRPVNGGDGTRTRLQIEWAAGWQGAPAHIAATPAEALAVIGVVGEAAARAEAEARAAARPGFRRVKAGGLVTNEEAVQVAAEAERSRAPLVEVCGRLTHHARIVGRSTCACGRDSRATNTGAQA